MPSPEELEQAPPSPEFVPMLVYPEFMPPEDEVFLAEEQPLLVVVSPTTNSPRYIADSDPEEDEEDLEEDPADYHADGGDDDDDDDESSDDDEDDDDDVEEDKDEEEEEHQLRLTLFHLLYTVLLAILTPTLSPISPFSSPLPPILSPLPQILSPPLPVSSPPLPARPTYPFGYRATMIWLRAETPSTSHPPPSSIPPLGTPPLLHIPLPTPSPHLLLPSTDCRAGVFEVTLPPRKRLYIALGMRDKDGDSSSTPTTRPTGGFKADYGFVGTLDDDIRQDPERYVGYGDTDEIYMRLDDAQDERLLMSGQLNMLRRDRLAHAHIARLVETEARLSHEAWVQSMDASNTARSEKMAPKRTTRSTLAATATTPTTVTDVQLKVLIDQGVSNALAARDADRTRNGEDSHD
ncbi:hypothetical protein Tco_1096243 [Tanacetum coccineum]